jgi:hypothetical protein
VRGGVGREGGAAGGHGRKRVHVDEHGLSRVARLVERLGDDEGDWVAHVAHLVRGERRLLRARRVRAVRHAVGRDGQAGDAGRREVGAEDDGEHARHLPRGGSVHAADQAVRVAAAHDDGVGLAGQGLVVAVGALAAEEDRVLGARHGLADGEASEVGIESIEHGTTL